MHFSRSSEVLYFHTDVVSVHTDSHTDLKRHVVASWAIYTEYKASRQAESRMYRCREREKRSQKEKSTRNSIKIGEICIVPRNMGKRRDVVERLRGNRNLSMKGDEKVGKPNGERTWRSMITNVRDRPIKYKNATGRKLLHSTVNTLFHFELNTQIGFVAFIAYAGIALRARSCRADVALRPSVNVVFSLQKEELEKEARERKGTNEASRRTENCGSERGSRLLIGTSQLPAASQLAYAHLPGGDAYAFVEFEDHITASAALTLNQRLFLKKPATATLWKNGRHERKDKEGQRVTREGSWIENSRGDRGDRGGRPGSLVSWPGREGVEGEGAGNWRLLLLLLADPILSWYIVACCTNVMRNYESCTQGIIIECKRGFYFSLHILRTIDASPSLSSLSPLRVRNCTRNNGVRDHLHTYRVIINIPTPYSRAVSFPSLDGRYGSEQAFFMDIIVAAEHIRRDCTAHWLKC
ncbi:hypothetical protein ALC62_10181 [Cyphomyrmex costatus]|uniref:Uncharacterized protein n=1 Tax=Cyphomyrmex costatus TaxID=456900 RepID=A0A195CE32_9HYME|nr:hypothetical protein ALC62_10181 [Cyphomyrmex costatus]